MPQPREATPADPNAPADSAPAAATDSAPRLDQQSLADDFPDVAGLSYEAARDELVGIVAQLESGQVPLADSMRLWRRGEALAAHCSTWLDSAEAALTSDES